MPVWIGVGVVTVDFVVVVDTLLVVVDVFDDTLLGLDDVVDVAAVVDAGFVVLVVDFGELVPDVEDFDEVVAEALGAGDGVTVLTVVPFTDATQ